MQILYSHVVTEAYGNEKGLLAGLKVTDLKSEAVSDLEVRCSIVTVCYSVNCQLFAFGGVCLYLQLTLMCMAHAWTDWCLCLHLTPGLV